MKKLVYLLLLTLSLPAAAKGRRARGYLCEKKDQAGKVTILHDAKSRKSCKKSGGRWVHSTSADTAADASPASASVATSTLTSSDAGQAPGEAAPPKTISTSAITSKDTSEGTAP